MVCGCLISPLPQFPRVLQATCALPSLVLFGVCKRAGEARGWGNPHPCWGRFWVTSVPCHLLPRSKGSAAELWRPWLFLPQHYWVLFWLLLLSVAFLLLLRVLELQRLQPAASPKA